MDSETVPMHYVCTLDEASALISAQSKFWLSVCDCRKVKGTCARGRLDVCLEFAATTASEGIDSREVSRLEVEELVAHARKTFLVARPFRCQDSPTRTEGICFCCDDCCAYFLDPTEPCDKGSYVAVTDMRECIHCGKCIEVCHFQARNVGEAELTVHPDQCFGCGLCADRCPIDCVKMVSRPRAGNDVSR